MGRLFDALAAYSSAIKEFSNEPVAYGGRADVLKNLGRLDDALAAYDDAISLFPENSVFLTGRADVLRSMGNYDAALTAYADAKKLFPYEPFAFTGYAKFSKTKEISKRRLRSTRRQYPSFLRMSVAEPGEQMCFVQQVDSPMPFRRMIAT